MKCRACDGAYFEPVISLGEAPLVRFPLMADVELPTAPLDLIQCKTCGLVQLEQAVHRDLLFRQYWYLSGVNETMVKHLSDIVAAVRACVMVEDRTVVDIGANDGTLLRQYPSTVRTVAWEPAMNLSPGAGRTSRGFFPDGADFLEPHSVAAVTSIAMLYDVDDLTKFAASVHRLLAKDGVWVVEVSDLDAVIATNGLDSICHEHLTYWDLDTFIVWANANQFDVSYSTRTAINGGSLCCVLRPKKFLLQEHPYQPRPVAAWAAGLHDVKATIIEMLSHEAGPIDLYGASTKGLTLLHWLGLDRRCFRQAIERSPAKVGRFYGNTKIPIVSEADGRSDPAAAWFVPIWQFKDAVVAREQEYLARGGRLIFPLPLPIIVSRTEVAA